MSKDKVIKDMKEDAKSNSKKLLAYKGKIRSIKADVKVALDEKEAVIAEKKKLQEEVKNLANEKASLQSLLDEKEASSTKNINTLIATVDSLTKLLQEEKEKKSGKLAKVNSEARPKLEPQQTGSIDEKGAIIQSQLDRERSPRSPRVIDPNVCDIGSKRQDIKGEKQHRSEGIAKKDIGSSEKKVRRTSRVNERKGSSPPKPLKTKSYGRIESVSEKDVIGFSEKKARRTSIGNERKGSSPPRPLTRQSYEDRRKKKTSKSTPPRPLPKLPSELHIHVSERDCKIEQASLDRAKARDSRIGENEKTYDLFLPAKELQGYIPHLDPRDHLAKVFSKKPDSEKLKLITVKEGESFYFNGGEDEFYVKDDKVVRKVPDGETSNLWKCIPLPICVPTKQESEVNGGWRH